MTPNQALTSCISWSQFDQLLIWVADDWSSVKLKKVGFQAERHGPIYSKRLISNQPLRRRTSGASTGPVCVFSQSWNRATGLTGRCLFCRYIIGKKGETRKRLETETKTSIAIPKQGVEGQIGRWSCDLSFRVTPRGWSWLFCQIESKILCFLANSEKSYQGWTGIKKSALDFCPSGPPTYI